MATIVCLYCGEVRIVPESRTHLKYCNRTCHKASRLMDEEELKKLSKRYHGNRTKVAEVLGIPYVTFWNRLRRQGLNHLFKARGGFYHGEG